MIFVRIQYDETGRSFRVVEDLLAQLLYGQLYPVASTRPDSDSYSEWIEQAIPEIAHA
jgi:hypothetical protein